MDLKKYFSLQGIWKGALTTEAAIMLAASVVIGIAGGYAAIGFRYLVKFASWFFPHIFGSSGFSSLPWYGVLILPVVGGLILGPIIRYISWEVRGSGIPEVIESCATSGGVIRKRVAFVKALAASISLGTGFSVGREGPIVQIGASIASSISQFLRASVKQLRTLVACGAAAGIAATFNTPFAGAMFAVEVVVGDFGSAKIGPIVISSVVGTVVSHHYLGNFPALAHVNFQMVSNWELIFYLLMGLTSGLAGAYFIKIMQFSGSVFSRLPVNEIFHPAIGGLLVGLTALLTPHSFGVGYEQINTVLGTGGSFTLATAAAILFAKVFATSVSIGSGASGGVFAPSLFLGAMSGYILGVLVNHIWPGMTAQPASYVLIAMGAFIAATTRAPITATLMIFEMTAHPSVILPLMAACIPATILSSWLKSESIYHVKLLLKGVKLDRHLERNVLKHILVSEVFQRERAPVLKRSSSLTEVIDEFLRTGAARGYIVDDDGKVIASISGQDLRYSIVNRMYLDDVVLAIDLAQPLTGTLSPMDDLSIAVQLLSSRKADSLPVADSDNKFLGDLVMGDIIEAYNNNIIYMDLPSSTVDAISMTERLGEIDLGDDHAMIEIQVPPHAIGKTLADLDIRRRLGIQVVLVSRILTDETGRKVRTRRVPGVTDMLAEGDFLLIAGERKNIRNATKL
ncbi:chloride channel protein [Myxococcota bacterium]|nr:chloride channel protein [Myxococcota bacterium]MBU1382724.1 chloride channel protein [Myxococcota bacterium]MBU1498399.1 chloride channel protein [Myxococcota bacterium]